MNKFMNNKKLVKMIEIDILLGWFMNANMIEITRKIIDTKAITEYNKNNLQESFPKGPKILCSKFNI
jgi:hypothetical protein